MGGEKRFRTVAGFPLWWLLEGEVGGSEEAGVAA
jgi:hypothetical protein